MLQRDKQVEDLNEKNHKLSIELNDLKAFFLRQNDYNFGPIDSDGDAFDDFERSDGN